MLAHTLRRTRTVGRFRAEYIVAVAAVFREYLGNQGRPPKSLEEKVVQNDVLDHIFKGRQNP